MFGKLRDKLKSSLSIFSKKAEEEVIEETEKVIEKKEEITKVEEKKTKPVKEKSEQPKSKPKKEESKKESKPVEEEKVIEKKKEITKVEETVVETKEEKKGFFRGLFSKSEDDEDIKPEVSEKTVEKEIKEETVTETVEEIKTEEPKDENKGFFGKIKQSLTTKQISAEKFEDMFWDLELVLLESNVSVKVIEKIKDDLKEELVDKPLPRDVAGKIQEVLKNTLTEILSIERFSLIDRINAKKESGEGPYVITFFGINGAGKTTSIAKLTYLLKNQGFSTVLAACDTFRAAAIQQLEDHANKIGVKMIKHDYGSDAAAVAYDAVKHAEKEKIDVVLIDTAGRLHSNANLMAELEKICRTNKPDLKVFIGESITGNDCVEQAEKFNELIELDAAILTKADIDENGGAPLSIAYTIKKPILYLGMGQEYKDFEEFNPELILQRLGFD